MIPLFVLMPLPFRHFSLPAPFVFLPASSLAPYSFWLPPSLSWPGFQPAFLPSQPKKKQAKSRYYYEMFICVLSKLNNTMRN